MLKPLRRIKSKRKYQIDTAFRPKRKDDEIRVKMDITVDLPAEVAEQAEQLGIYEFERCIYDPDTRRMTASVTTTFYRKGA